MAVDEPDSLSLSSVSTSSEIPPSYCSKGLPSYRSTSPPSDVLYQPLADPGDLPRYSSRRPSAVLNNFSVEEQPTTQSEELRSGKHRSIARGCCFFWVCLLSFAVLAGGVMSILALIALVDNATKAAVVEIPIVMADGLHEVADILNGGSG